MKPAITITNYEEFFLLYIDGELTCVEKQAVEQFVENNPHLAEEFDRLQQIKLPDEQMAFADKEILYRQAGSEIGTDNYESFFLLYIDNELDNTERKSVETFVLQHPQYQEQFMLLKKTKLKPDTIRFPGKEALYRKEEKRLVYLRWQPVAVAAAFIGIISMVWILVPSGSNNSSAPVVLQKSTTVATIAPKKPTATTSTTAVTLHTATDRINSSPAYVIQRGKQNRNRNSIGRPPASTDNAAITPNPKDTIAIYKMPPPIALPNMVANTTSKPDIRERITETITVKNTEPENNMAPDAQPTVYKLLDIENDDSRKTMYVGALELNKDKFRGFFRKAASLFRGKERQPEEEKTENTRSLR